MMLWPNRVIGWLRRHGVVAYLALGVAAVLLAGIVVAALEGRGGGPPSVVHMRPR